MREFQYMVTITAIALSVTYGSIYLVEGWHELINHLFVATLAPLIIAPPTAFVGMRRKIRIEELNNELHFLLSHDQLTKACTRSRLMEVFRARETDKIVLLLDADNFKKLNDTHGHVIGDEALVHLVERMRSVTREGDVICRWGGEEFVLLLANSDLEHACEICSRLIQTLNETGLPTPLGELFVTVSIGVTGCSKNESLEGAIERADKALYNAKRSGRNRFVIANSPASKSDTGSNKFGMPGVSTSRNTNGYPESNLI